MEKKKIIGLVVYFTKPEEVKIYETLRKYAFDKKTSMSGVIKETLRKKFKKEQYGNQ